MKKLWLTLLFTIVLFGVYNMPKAHAAISFVAGTSTQSGASPVSFGKLSSVSAKDLIVLFAMGDGGSLAIPAVSNVTDTLANTFTEVPNFEFANVAGTQNMGVWYAVVTNAGSNDVITVTFNASAENFAGVVQQFTGFTGTATLDKMSTTTTATASTTCAMGTTGVTTQANEVVIGGCEHASTASAFSLGTGYSNLTQISVAARQSAMQSKIISSTGAQTGKMTIAAARVNIGGIVTFYDNAPPPSGLYSGTPVARFVNGIFQFINGIFQFK